MQETKIILCHFCKGHGTLSHWELVNHHHGEYEETIHTCTHCKGSGRRLEITSVTYEFFEEKLKQ